MYGTISVSQIARQLFDFYYLLLIIRIFLSWIPNIDWQSRPFNWVSLLCDPFLNLFRGIIPPIAGMLDISPILAFIALLVMQTLVLNVLNMIGL